MKLKTSCFNTSVLKKDITRFAPLWGLYTVLMLLILLLYWSDYSTPAQFARNADELMIVMGAINCGYAGLAAFFLFGDLFKAKLCNALHAMPMRRDGWFLTHSAAGLLFCLVPNALGAVLAAAMLGKYAFLAYVWLGLMLLQYICFFGIGVFSIMCAGNSLGATAIYGIINFLSVLVLWMVKCFYEPVLFGVTIEEMTLARLSPVIAFCSQNYVNITYFYEAGTLIFNGFIGASWLYVLFAALAGLGLMVAALFMYRNRKLESAGDFIAFRPARPVFLVLYSLCVAAMLYVVADAIDNGLGTFFLLVGLAIGWFTGLMLLHRRVNVFRMKTFAGFGVLVFAFYLSVSLFWLDPLGITRYVPKADQVQSVRVAPYTSDYYYSAHAAVVTDPAQIEKITQIHRDLVEVREENPQYSVLRIRYTMKTGVEVERTYHLNAASENGQWMKNIYSSLDAVLGSGNLDQLKKAVRYASVYSYAWEMNPEEYYGKGHFEIEDKDLDGLLDAIAMDCEAGNMTQIWEYHENEEQVAVLSIEIGGSYRELQVYKSCVYTANYLEVLASNLPTE